MPNTKFDSKSFNPEAFGKYVERIPNVKKNQLIQSRAVGTNENAKTVLSTQTGSLYARIPYFGRISGSTSQNNDGNTNIKSNSTTTYEQGFITASRMDSWTERSFSKNITAGVDFMDKVARRPTGPAPCNPGWGICYENHWNHCGSKSGKGICRKTHF